MNVPRHWLRLPIVRHLRSWQLRTLIPHHSGASKGTPVVRYYFDKFLEQYRSDVRGRCLEIGETKHIVELGGAAVTSAEALDLVAHSADVKVVADLSRADHVPSDQYDCFLNQFTMTVVYDFDAAMYHAIRILKPGGVLLVNFGCVDYYLHGGLDMGTGKPLYMYNWFTPLQVENIFRRLDLTEQDYEMEVYGNLFTRIAFQVNISAEELTARELDTVDPGHPLLIAVRAKKPENWNPSRPEYRDPIYIPTDAPAQAHPETGHYGDTYL